MAESKITSRSPCEIVDRIVFWVDEIYGFDGLGQASVINKTFYLSARRRMRRYLAQPFEKRWAKESLFIYAIRTANYAGIGMVLEFAPHMAEIWHSDALDICRGQDSYEAMKALINLCGVKPTKMMVLAVIRLKEWNTVRLFYEYFHRKDPLTRKFNKALAGGMTGVGYVIGNGGNGIRWPEPISQQEYNAHLISITKRYIKDNLTIIQSGHVRIFTIISDVIKEYRDHELKQR